MLILIAIPVIVLVASCHRLVQAVAPTNMLTRAVNSAVPRWRTAVGLLALSMILVGGMHALSREVAGGGPGWLNLVVLVLAWDAIKMGLLAAVVTVRCLVRLSSQRRRPPTRSVAWSPSRST